METTIQRLFNKKRIYVAILICLLVVGWIYWRELSKGSSDLKALSWTKSSFIFLGLGLIFMAMRDFAYMVRIRLLTAKKLTWRQAFDIIMIWEFASAISPGVVGGSAVAVFILEREKIPIAESTTVVITTLILDNLFYILIIPLIFFSLDHAVLLPKTMGWFTDYGMPLFWSAYLVIVFINLILILSVFVRPEIIERIIHQLFRLRWLKRWKKASEKFAGDIKISSKGLKNKSLIFWVKLMGTTMWSWTARFLVVNMVLAAFIPVGFGDHLLILARQLMMWLGMLLTPTPGGSGMAELAFTALFQNYIDQIAVSAIALALIWRTLSYYPYLFIGVYLFPNWLSRKSTENKSM